MAICEGTCFPQAPVQSNQRTMQSETTQPPKYLLPAPSQPKITSGELRSQQLSKLQEGFQVRCSFQEGWQTTRHSQTTHTYIGLLSRKEYFLRAIFGFRMWPNSIRLASRGRRGVVCRTKPSSRHGLTNVVEPEPEPNGWPVSVPGPVKGKGGSPLLNGCLFVPFQTKQKGRLVSLRNQTHKSNYTPQKHPCMCTVLCAVIKAPSESHSHGSPMLAMVIQS